MPRYQRIPKLITNTITEDGEQVAQHIEYETRTCKSKEEFHMVYDNMKSQFRNISLPAAKTMRWCSAKAALNNPEVNLNKFYKQQIAEEMGISLSAVNNSITELSKAKFLLPVGRGVYTVNPLYSWRGDLDARERVIQVLSTYILEDEQQGTIQHVAG